MDLLTPRTILAPIDFSDLSRHALAMESGAATISGGLKATLGCHRRCLLAACGET